MSAFDDEEIPLINGTLRGIRAFKILPDGSLSSVTINSGEFAYTEGVNHAECYLPAVLINKGMVEATEFDYNHKPPYRICMCGFYAYFKQTHENGDSSFAHSSSRRVVGIVEASGRCIVGDLGFRAEKMKIVALVDDTSSDPSVRRPIKQRTADAAMSYAGWWSRNVNWTTVLAVISVQFLLVLLSVTLDMPILGWINNAITGFIIFSAVFSIVGSYLQLNETYKASLGALENKTVPPPEQVSKKIRAKYPNVAHYRTLEDAMVDFPISDRIAS